jgi:hypothetical protein
MINLLSAADLRIALIISEHSLNAGLCEISEKLNAPACLGVLLERNQTAAKAIQEPRSTKCLN